jgi:hypothetical protein
MSITMQAYICSTGLMYCNNNIEKNKDSEHIEPMIDSPNHSIFVENVETNNQNVKILKLQDNLAIITAEWKNKSGQDIRSLQEAIKQTAQIERARIAICKN